MIRHPGPRAFRQGWGQDPARRPPDGATGHGEDAYGKGAAPLARSRFAALWAFHLLDLFGTLISEISRLAGESGVPFIQWRS